MKYYNVSIKCDDSYPKTHETKIIGATSAGRAAYLMEKYWRKMHPQKREPQKLTIVVVRI